MSDDQKSTEEEKNSYLEMLAEKILEFDKKLDDFKIKAKDASEEAKGDLDEVVETLKVKREEMKGTFQNIKDHSGDGWTELKGGAESAFEELKKGFQSAYSKFKDPEDKD